MIFEWFKKLNKKTYVNVEDLTLSAKDLALNHEYAYFLLDASYGDKWLILSFLPVLIRFHKSVKIIASNTDKKLIQLFLDDCDVSDHLVFYSPEYIFQLSSLFLPNSKASGPYVIDPHQLAQTSSIIKRGFPLNRLRHLHIVKYPYFSDLYLVHGIPYGILLKMLLYLPSDALPSYPRNYSDEDIQWVDDLISDLSVKNDFIGVILFNIANFSHHELSIDQITIVVNSFLSLGLTVLINTAEYHSKDIISSMYLETTMVVHKDIPAHLLALISNKVAGVYGVMGGAMSVAAHFSKAHFASLYSKPHGFSYNSSTVHGGIQTDSVWTLENNIWPVILSDRLVSNIEIGNPVDLTEETLSQITLDFGVKLKKLINTTNICEI